MKKLLTVLSFALLAACTKTVYVFPDAPPPPPKVKEDIKEACPPLPQLTDKSIQTLYKADKAAAYEYARCKTKHAAAVNILDEWTKNYNEYIAAYEKAKKDAKK